MATDTTTAQPSLAQLVSGIFGGQLGPAYGAQEGANFYEHGVDVLLPGNQPVHLLEAGVYRADLSTPYQQVFQDTANPKQFDSYTHVDTNPGLSGGAAYPAGALVGYVDPNVQSNLSVPAQQYGAYKYYSDATHLEFGVGHDITNPGQFFDFAHTTDPTATLAANYGATLAGGTHYAPPGSQAGGQGQIGATVPDQPTAPHLAPGQPNPNPSGGLNLGISNPFAGLGNAFSGIAGVLGAAGQWTVIALVAVVFLVLLVRG